MDQKSIGVTQKAIVLRADGKFLALRRSKTDPFHALAWDLPGGVLEYGEQPYDGMLREIREEVGIEVVDLKPFDVLGRENPSGFRVTISYVCTCTSENVVLSYEHDDYKWVTREEFLKLQTTEKLLQIVSNFKEE